MESGRALVIGAIMKRQGVPFRARHLVEATQLDRRNVAYHLGKLLELGLLERDGVIYSVTNVEAIINELVEKTDSGHKKRAEDTIIYTHSKTLNTMMDYAVTARAMDLPDSLEFKTAILAELEKTIKSMKQAKKWLSTTTRTPGSARSKYKKEPKFAEELWTYMTEGMHLEVTCSRRELEDAIEEFVEDTYA